MQTTVARRKGQGFLIRILEANRVGAVVASATSRTVGHVEQRDQVVLDLGILDIRVGIYLEAH